MTDTNRAPTLAIGNQLELALSQKDMTELSLSVSASLFETGQFITDTSPAEPMNMVGLQSTFQVLIVQALVLTAVGRRCRLVQ